MKKNKEAKLFAFKIAEKKASVKTEKKWKARDNVAIAGCSGPWARADRRNRDDGVFC